MSLLFKNLSLLDPNWKEAQGGYEVLVEGDTIKEVSSKPIRSRQARVMASQVISPRLTAAAILLAVHSFNGACMSW